MRLWYPDFSYILLRCCKLTCGSIPAARPPPVASASTEQEAAGNSQRCQRTARSWSIYASPRVCQFPTSTWLNLTYLAVSKSWHPINWAALSPAYAVLKLYGMSGSLSSASEQIQSQSFPARSVQPNLHSSKFATPNCLHVIGKRVHQGILFDHQH